MVVVGSDKDTTGESKRERKMEDKERERRGQNGKRGRKTRGEKEKKRTVMRERDVVTCVFLLSRHII